MLACDTFSSNNILSLEFTQIEQGVCYDANCNYILQRTNVGHNVLGNVCHREQFQHKLLECKKFKAQSNKEHKRIVNLVQCNVTYVWGASNQRKEIHSQ